MCSHARALDGKVIMIKTEVCDQEKKKTSPAIIESSRFIAHKNLPISFCNPPATLSHPPHPGFWGFFSVCIVLIIPPSHDNMFSSLVSCPSHWASCPDLQVSSLTFIFPFRGYTLLYLYAVFVRGVSHFFVPIRTSSGGAVLIRSRVVSKNACLNSNQWSIRCPLLS